MELIEVAATRLSWSWWLIGVIIALAVIYRLGTGEPFASGSSAGYGCGAAVAITLVFVIAVLIVGVRGHPISWR